MKTQRNIVWIALSIIMLGSLNTTAQEYDPNSQSSKKAEPIHLSGPRVGLTYLHNFHPSETTRNNLGWSEDTPIPQTITQFGWHFEWNYFQTETGNQGLIQVLPLVGGFDQGLFLPSVSVLTGFRMNSGWEVGFGPTAGITSIGFVYAMGYTFKSGEMNIPINLAITPTRESTRISLMIGWNMN